MTAALCPGSFDPPTNGHIDVIERCLAVFDRVVVAVVRNPSKQPMFSAEERLEMIAKAFPEGVEIHTFDGLLVDFAAEVGVDVVVKGLRAVGDFDYELQMAQMNRTLTGVETVFLPTNPEWSYLSSSLVREVARLGGEYRGLVPPHVAAALEERLR
ncbi:MAG TPA: pantetheine-phosphate adenylyltransferase [Acidimicrobiia bacterium]|jgi:pantetheine-phosphate adenylyltransferase|nr:pantetheine-phosphate adenylyltransferase [Acidimicrobiia bacterium]